MIRRNKKIISTILAMTVVSGIVTPAYATEVGIDASADQSFTLENAELEKVSDDTDILDDSSADTTETENNTVVNESLNNEEEKSEIINSEEEINDKEINTSEEKNENSNVPLYDSIDEEMENYLKEYLQNTNSGVSDEEMQKLVQEYLDKMNTENIETNNEELSQLKDGIYSVDNYVLKSDSDEQSMLRSYISDEIKLEVKNGKISVIVTFDENANTLDNCKILINDKNTTYKTVESNDTELRIKFNINKLTDNIVLKADIENDYYSKSEECRIILDTTSMEKIEEDVEVEESSELEDGIYKINNNTLKIDKDNQSVLGNYLSDESILEVKNGQKYLTFIFDKDVSTMSSYQVYVNSYNGGYKILESNDDVLKLKFEIDSLDDEIVFETNITNEFYNEKVMARVFLDSDSVEKVNSVNEAEEEAEEEEEEDYVIQDAEEEAEVMVLAEEADYSDSGYDITVTDNSDNKLTESKLIIKDGKMVGQFTFNDASDLGIVKEIKMNGETIANLSDIVKEDKDLNTVTIEVAINSFEDVINVVFSKTEDNDGWNNTSLNNIEIKDIKLNKGTYELEATSNANKHVSSIKLEINDNGKMYLITTFGMGSMITVTDLHVNDKSQSYSTKLVGQGFKSTLTVKSEINSLDDVVNMFVDINLTAMGMGIMSHDMEFTELRFKGVSAPKDEIEEEGPEEEPEEEEDDIVQGTPLEDGEYTIGTNIFKTGTQESSMAASFFDKESDLVVKDKKYYLSVNSNSLSMMSKIVIEVDGNKVETKIEKNSDGDSGTISFEIPRLNSKIVMYCHVEAGAHVADYDFAIALDKNNIINKSTNEKVDPPVEYEEVELIKNTAYTIKNKIKTTSSNEAEALATFVDEASIIEVDGDGNIYLTLNFTMSGLMNGRTIKLNNNESVTTYAVVNSNNTNGIRFKIGSLSDRIYISNQYGSSVDDGFSLVLLEDTLEKTGIISGSGSGSGSSTTEDSSTSDDDDDDDDIEDGTYVIKNNCYKENSDTTSDARGYLDTKSVLIVDDGDMYVILKFTHGKMMSDTSVRVEDKKVSIKTVKNSGNKYYIKFKIDSLSDEIMVKSTIDTGIPAIGVLEGVKFRVLLKESTLKEDDDAADFDDEEEVEEETTTDEEVKVEESVQEDTIVTPPSNEIIDSNIAIEQSKKSIYKVNNEILTDSQIGYQAARGAVNQISLYEIEDGKKYITLGFSQTDILNNIRISNNGQDISYTVVGEDKANHTMKIKFEVPSLSTQLTVKANVTAMGRDISFGLKFLETTLELISTEESERITNNTGSNGGSSSSGILSGLSSTTSNLFSGGSASEGGIEVSEEAVEDLASLAKEYFKKYTVNNEVLSDSAIGRTMARKYLSETSIIEEIDGQLYATITFSSASSMGNFRIDVNGETVSHTVPLKDVGNDLISLRFPISSVNDDIRTYIFISPMKMNIDFGIKFLEDTMTLIDEGTIGEEGNNESSSLADTLSNLNQASQSNKNQMSTVKVAASTSLMVIVLNQGIAGLGSLFRRFKNKSLLSKITNKE